MRASEPGMIGRVRIKNRIAMAPMISNIANPDGSTNDNHITYLEERARGGTGLIITEYTYVDGRNARGSWNELGAHRKEFVPKLRRLTDRVHMHGSKIFMQLVHAGGKAGREMNVQEPMAPSAVDYLGSTPREMTAGDIDQLIEDYIKAAEIAHKSKFDGIELHGAHGYLIQEFLSPALNRRSDRYGGSLENRIRLPQEILSGIKDRIDIPVGIRLSLYEDDEDGYGPDYGLKTAEGIEGLDYVHFSAGRFAPPGSSSSFYGDSLHIFRRLPRKPDITTMIVGSVLSQQDVETALEKVDFVSVGRALLADPYFAKKVITSRGSIRPCIRCNQACRDISLGEVRCTVNPGTGYENLREPVKKLTGDIAIAGSGVKGLEAALMASSTGLKVTLYEMRDSIGGQLLDIRDEKKKTEFGRLVTYYESILKRKGVEIVTGTEYSGDGLYCLPDVSYPDIESSGKVSIDSDVYKYHDAALYLAENHEVEMSRRSLRSLDRTRRSEYVRKAESLGIKFVDHENREFTISLMDREQYDLRKAMISGRNALMEYVNSREEYV